MVIYTTLTLPKIKKPDFKKHLCFLQHEREAQEMEKYLAECKKDRRKYKALVLLFALGMLAVITVAELNLIPFTAINTMLQILTVFSELTSMFVTLFGAIFIIKHILKYKNPISGFKLVMPVALGITFSVYIAKCLLNLLLVL